MAVAAAPPTMAASPSSSAVCYKRLKTGGLDAMADLMDAADNTASYMSLSPSSSSSASSDEDSPYGRARRARRSSSGSLWWRSTEDVATCHAGSSLVAIMA
uniref:Uncharacterized protein n=2 Tax=Oryza TaxID=4527 RepID=A0A0E0NLZ4_ORYRU